MTDNVKRVWTAEEIDVWAEFRETDQYAEFDSKGLCAYLADCTQRVAELEVQVAFSEAREQDAYENAVFCQERTILDLRARIAELERENARLRKANCKLDNERAAREMAGGLASCKTDYARIAENERLRQWAEKNIPHTRVSNDDSPTVEVDIYEFWAALRGEPEE